MVSLTGLLLVSLSVGLDNFAAAIGIGMGGVNASTRWRLALVFGFFEATMPVVGLLIGQTLSGSIGSIGHYAGAGLLVLTGLYALWQAWRERQEVVESETTSNNKQAHFGRLLLIGLALSIDNLVIGFALSFSNVPLALAAGVIGVVSVGLSLIGLELGQRLGKRTEEWSEVFSGVILILVGVAIGFGFF